MKRFRQPLSVVLSATALAFATPTLATTYVVDTENDEIIANGQLSFREALGAANSNSPVGDAPAGDATGDRILFADGINEILVEPAVVELTIEDDLEVLGGEGVTLNAQNGMGVRLLNITTSEPVSIRDLLLTNGAGTTNGGAVLISENADVTMVRVAVTSSSTDGAAAGEGGGAIFSAGSLRMIDSEIRGNTVTGTAGNGGGIFNTSTGSLTLVRTDVIANEANRAGGGIENDGGTVVIVDSTLNRNIVNLAPGNGGGLHSGSGLVVVRGGRVVNNSAGNEGGGLWNGTSGLMRVRSSNEGPTTISNNTTPGGAMGDSTRGGGGIFNLGNLRVEDATISGNSATGVAGNGGGLMNRGGVMNIVNSKIVRNTAIRAGGGIEDQGDGRVSVVNTVVSNNSVNEMGANPGNGGGLHSSGGDITVEGGVFRGNEAAREGGGLWTSGSLVVMAMPDESPIPTVISDNLAHGDSADDGGAGLFNQGGDMLVTGAVIRGNQSVGTSGSGGGILNNGGTLQVVNTTITDNRAARAGGGIEDNAGTVIIEDSLLTRNATITTMTITANPGNGGGFHTTGDSDISITGTDVLRNEAASEGGGLWNSIGRMVVRDSQVSNNIAEGDAADNGGGGLFNAGGTLIVENVDVDNNSATGTAGSGGGIFNDDGELVVRDSEISGNTAMRAGGGIETTGTSVFSSSVRVLGTTLDSNDGGASPGNGGGLHTTGASDVIVDDSTVSNNVSANEGGGLWNSLTGDLSVYNSTLSGNDSGAGTGIFNTGGAVLTINTTIANNVSMMWGVYAVDNESAGPFRLLNTIVGGNGLDVIGPVEGNNNLIEVLGESGSIDGNNNIIGEDPGLEEELADNGSASPTGRVLETHALLEDSPAIDSADDSRCDAGRIAGLDQRGIARPQDGDEVLGAVCDMGSYELEVVLPPV